MSPDPLEGIVGDPQSWNRYAYVENDPINLSDPSGQGFWDDLVNGIANVFSDLVSLLSAGEINLNNVGGAGFGDPQQASSCGSYGGGQFCLQITIPPVGSLPGGSTGAGGAPPDLSPSYYPMPTCGGCTGSTGPPGTGVGGGPGTTGGDPGEQGPGGQGVGAPGSWGAGGADTIGPGTASPAQADVWHSVTAAEVSKAVISYFKATGPRRIKVINILNGFGTNWTLSGDNLRAGITAAKQSPGVNIPGTADQVLANIDSISRTGDQVAITNKQPLNTTFANLKQSVTFKISGERLQNIQGLSVGVGKLKIPYKNWNP